MKPHVSGSQATVAVTACQPTNAASRPLTVP